MPDDTRDQHIIVPLEAGDPAIGRALWLFEDARRLTRRTLEGIDPRALDWLPADADNSIGTLLYHIAIIEADWLYVEVLEQEFPPDVVELFPYNVRNATGRLTPVTGRTLEEHDTLLDAVRARLLAAFRAMSIDDFRRARRMPHYDVTPEWVLHHLMQDEAEHRGQIGDLRRRAEFALSESLR
jgi:uncharacterized damage-inducible protein DinB